MRQFLFLFLLVGWSGLSFAQSSSSSDTPDYGQSFIPDYTFHGSSLAAWHVTGKANWQAENGMITAKPSSANEGSLLVLDSSYQDAGLHCLFKLSAGSEAGYHHAYHQGR